MDEQVFKMFMKEFDDIKKQNTDQLTLMRDHIKESVVVHKVVERHSTYFSILGLGLTPIIAWVSWKLGFK